MRPRKMTREEPFRRPFAEAALRDDRPLALLVRQRSQPVELELRARECDRVLRLSSREADGDEVLLLRTRKHRARRELPDVPDRAPEALDHPVSDRHGREERDLLRRDRTDE